MNEYWRRSESTDGDVSSTARPDRAGAGRTTRDLPAVQGKGDMTDDPARTQATAAEGVAGQGGSLPFMDVIQASFGHHDVGGIQSHVGGAAGDAATSIGAQAYATGNHVAFQGQPDLHTAAHEAAHVVQQQAGVQLKGGVGQAGDQYEQHADQVADLVVQGKSAESALDQYATPISGRWLSGGPIQRKADAHADADHDHGKDDAEDTEHDHADDEAVDGADLAETADSAAPVQAKRHDNGPMTPAKLDRLLNGEVKGLLKLYRAQKIDQGTAFSKLIKYSEKVNGGTMPWQALIKMTELVTEMVRIDIARAKAKEVADGGGGGGGDPVVKPGGGGGGNVTPTAPSGDKPAPPPPADAGDLHDGNLASQVAALNDPVATEIAADIASLEKIKHKKERNQEVGASRDQLVAGIKTVRAKIATLPGTAAYKKVKAGFYRAIQDVNAFYEQYGNIDILEGQEQAKAIGKTTSVKTRTCNITSTSMALESLGKTAEDYDSSLRSRIVAIANHWSGRVGEAADSRNKGAGGWAEVSGLRLPDFMEMAAIAECMGSDDADIEAATKKAWGKILGSDFLVTLAGRFGAKGDVRYTATGKSVKAVRKQVEGLTDERNKRGGGAESDAAEVNQIAGQTDEEVEKFKSSVMSHVGPELDAGAGIVVGLSGHYVRLQNLGDHFLIIDDPGSMNKANRKVTWEEARAMAYFKFRIVFTG